MLDLNETACESAKEMIFEGDVFCSWADAWSVNEIDAPLIVLVDGAMYDRCFVTLWDYIVQFAEEINEWDEIAEGLGKSDVFTFGGGQRDFGLKLAPPNDRTVGVKDDVSGTGENG